MRRVVALTESEPAPYASRVSKLRKVLRNTRRFIADFQVHSRVYDRLHSALGSERVYGESSFQGTLSILRRTKSAFHLASKEERTRSVRELEELFFELIVGLDPDLFVEAGAKEAMASRRASADLPRAKVVAFEANPYTHARFQKKCDYAREGVAYRNIALTSSPGTVTFNVRRREDGAPSADGQGSLLKHHNYAPGHEQVKVPATTLDHVVEEFGGKSCALWIDVEGATGEVLGGSDKTLAKACALFIEVEDREFWGRQWLSKQVLLHLYRHNLIPVARDFQSRHQYNVLCVAKPLLSGAAYRRVYEGYAKRIRDGAPVRHA